MILKDTQLIILNYKRMDNVLKIAYKFQGFIPILIVNNNPKITIEIPKILIHNNNKNNWCIERWYWVQKSRFKYSIILDDDILPTKHCLFKLRKMIEKYPTSIISIYGKNNLNNSKKYKDLTDVWCVDRNIDLAIGSCLIVDNNNLRKIFNDYIKPWGYIKRGDDLLISLSFSHFFKSIHKTINTEVTLLDEMNVGLNKSSEHYKLRWKVVEDFKKLHSI